MNRSVAALVAGFLALAVLAPMPGSTAAPAAPAEGSRLQSSAAAAAVTLGATYPGSGLSFSCGDTAMVQKSTSTDSPSYAVPSAGVITSFSMRGIAGTGENIVRLLLFGPPTGNAFPLKAKSDPYLLQPAQLNTYAVRVPVEPGWRLGMRTRFLGPNACGYAVSSNGNVLERDNFDPEAADTLVITTPSDFDVVLMNLSAVLEPDADGDGYGDLSQDGCPQDVTTAGPCARPDTVIGKRPPKKGTKRKVTVTFKSSIAGSTFVCSLDGAAAKPCSSPFTKKLGYGKHVLRVRASSPLGLTDPTPAKVTFRIVRPARG